MESAPRGHKIWIRFPATASMYRGRHLLMRLRCYCKPHTETVHALIFADLDLYAQLAAEFLDLFQELVQIRSAHSLVLRTNAGTRPSEPSFRSAHRWQGRRSHVRTTSR